jgi:hypothetical protein
MPPRVSAETRERGASLAAGRWRGAGFPAGQAVSEDEDPG